MAQQAPSRDLDKVVIRMPSGMRPEISGIAKRNLRSTNNQIVWMLQQMLEREKETTPASDPAPAEA